MHFTEAWEESYFLFKIMNEEAASMSLVKIVHPLFDSWTVTVEVTERSIKLHCG